VRLLSKYIALIILAVPGIAAVVGVKLIRDTLFNSVDAPLPSLWLQFVLGCVLLVAGVAFIGGWIFYRDRKRHYVAKKYREK
jgi:hypothetical protein